MTTLETYDLNQSHIQELWREADHLHDIDEFHVNAEVILGAIMVKVIVIGILLMIFATGLEAILH
ncbi:MAG: hypothetical protein WBC91_25665 [Phototrophicaceae bacterium]